MSAWSTAHTARLPSGLDVEFFLWAKTARGHWNADRPAPLPPPRILSWAERSSPGHLMLIRMYCDQLDSPAEKHARQALRAQRRETRPERLSDVDRWRKEAELERARGKGWSQ
jgi:hypothetical protein